MPPVYYFQIFEDITSETVRRIADFIREISYKCKVTLEICSYGGSIFDGLAVLQMIQVSRHRGAIWTARVYGLAASTAADIALACDYIEMASTASLMIHSAWNDDGSHDEGIRVANEAQLSVITKRLPDYTKNDLKEDHWFQADEALSIGLIDSIINVDDSDTAPRLAAKYISIHNGEVKMEEVKKEEMIEEKGEEILEEEEVREERPSMDDVLERIAERLEDIEKRLVKLENGEQAQAACGDDERRENGRLKAVYDRIQAICKPAQPKAVKPIQADPKEELERYKAKYGNSAYKSYIDG